MGRLVACVALAVALVAACANDPLPTTPAPGYPCGVAYVACTGPDGALNGMCCDQDNTCGGGQFSVGCPAGMCCYIGPGSFEQRRRPTPQKAPRP
jgi:hypothetical protein